MSGGVVFGVFLQALVAWALRAWALRVARRHNTEPFWRRVTWLPVAAFVLKLLGMVLTVIFLVRAFGAVSAVDAARKADLLSQGIAHALTFTLGISLPAWGIDVVSVALSLVGQFKAPRSVAAT